MKKPKDVADLADRLTLAATAPLMTAPLAASPVEQAVLPAEPIPTQAAAPRARRLAPKRSTKTVYLRVPAPLYDHYDNEAVRRTKATGRGVTVQQVILDHLAGRIA